VPELIDRRVGELAEPDSAASMAAAIRQLYDRDLGTLGTAARNRVLQRFTWSHSLNILLANYASVLDGGVTLPEFGAGAEVGS
jgi:glycosyltransferase involved in cell wall biosynthesis